LRHFGCISCRSLAVDIWKNKEKYEKDGARIIFIGNGKANFINGFKEQLGLGEVPIFTDPTLQSFRAAGFKRGFLAALGPKAIVNVYKMYGEGHRQGPTNKESGDLWQLGGVLVIKPDGRVGYHYISEVTGDYPPEGDIVSD
jgi:hypothetical protein